MVEKMAIGSALQRFLAAICLVVFVLQSQQSTATARQIIPGKPADRGLSTGQDLDKILNPDGTLNVSAASQGSFDAAGWSMLAPAGGPPRFVRNSQRAQSPNPITPHAPQVAGDEFWSSQFLDGVSTFGYHDVKAITVNGGNVFVGGIFTQVGGLFVNNIARWDTFVQRWFPMGSGVSGPVYTLLSSGPYVYVGGYFNSVNGQAAGSLARWDTTNLTFVPLGGSNAVAGNGNLGIVNGLAADATGNLVVGGEFDHAGGVAAQNVARYVGGTWSALGAGLGPGVNDYVLTVAVSGSDIYAGGHFSTPFANIARWNGSDWVSMGDASAVVHVITVDGPNVYAGGEFTTIGSTVVNYIGRWTGGSTWQGLVGGGADNYVTSIVPVPGGLYVGGGFVNIGSSPIAANRLAFWNGSGWFGLGNGLDDTVFALAVQGSDVYSGGIFKAAVDTNFDANLVDNIARWNTSAGVWYEMGNSLPQVVSAVAIQGGLVYVGGHFNSAGGIPVNNLAVWDSRTGLWSDVGGGVTGCSAKNFCSTTVFSIAVNGVDVYVGGNFAAAGGLASPMLARWKTNSASWSAGDLGGCVGPNCQTSVRSLSPAGSGVYAGGYFSSANCLQACITVNNVVYWDGLATYQPLSDGGNIGTNDIVYAVLYDGFETFVGGLFTSPRAHLALFDGSSWFGLGSPLNDSVYALAEDSAYLYAGGLFSNAAGNPAGNRIARISMTSLGDWLPMGSGLDGSVEALTFNGSDLIAGGRFTNSGLIGGLNHIARWNTVSESWSPIGSGMDDDVISLAGAPGQIYAGGIFISAGGKESNHFARWVDFKTYYLPVVMK